MTTVLTHLPDQIAARATLSLTLVVSGIAHAYLYIHGYHQIPTVGTAFVVQGSAFITLAVLILVGGPRWLYSAAGLAALASLIAFAMSRNVGLLGFVEHGWDPPYGPLTVAAEALTVLLAAVLVLPQLRRPGK